MQKLEGDSVAEDAVYQAALDAGLRYVVMSNDGETAPQYYASWQEAEAASVTLNATADMDTSFWVEAA
jgi:hypothetical protein